MLEEHCDIEVLPRVQKKKSLIAFYFDKAKALEFAPGYVDFLNIEAKQFYSKKLQEAYDILFDRVMTSRISPFLKQEVEQWYSFNRDFLVFCDTAEMNRELEQLLRRFELL